MHTGDMDPARVFDLDDSGELAVVLCHFNPCLYSNPVRNLSRVLSWLHQEQLPTYAVELRCGKSLHAPPQLPINHPKVVQLRSASVMFQKENLWNIAVSHLPHSFRYVLCLDADVFLCGDQWHQGLLRQLRTHRIVQPFSRAIWTDSLGNAYRKKISSVFAFTNGLDNPESGKIYHPGFAVACDRDFWSATPGFYNGPLGEGASCLMAAIMGRSVSMSPYFAGVSEAFLDSYLTWADVVFKWTDGRLCYTNCDALHLWHGATQQRKYIWHAPTSHPTYIERRKWFKGFNPNEDFHIDPHSGLITWSPSALSEKRDLIAEIEKYFSNRSEDVWFDSSIS